MSLGFLRDSRITTFWVILICALKGWMNSRERDGLVGRQRGCRRLSRHLLGWLRASGWLGGAGGLRQLVAVGAGKELQERDLVRG